MCGRYTLRSKPETIAEEFDLDEVPLLEPRYNITPTQPVPAVRLDPRSHQREFSLFQWGLIPSWAKEPSIGNKMINARAETVAEKPAFRHSFRSKRCLVIADAFYEWRKVDGRKQPYFIHLKTTGPSPSPASGTTGSGPKERSSPAP